MRMRVERKFGAPIKALQLARSLIAGLLSCALIGLESGASQSGANSLHFKVQYPTFQRCSGGAPLHWRPHLDAASKAYLAPIVAVASLKHLNLTPIQLTGTSGSQVQNARQAQLVYHPQNVNNEGVNIEATFVILRVLKQSSPVRLEEAQKLKLLYRVSASLSTTTAIMTLANGDIIAANSNNTSEQQVATSGEFMSHLNSIQNQRQTLNQSKSQKQRTTEQPLAGVCPLDLSEHELAKKVNKIFKMNQNYVLFLEQAFATNQRQQQQQHQQHQQQQQNQQQQLRQRQSAQQVAQIKSHPLWDAPLHPFATHELLTNQTYRALREIIIKGRGKFQWALFNDNELFSVRSGKRKRCLEVGELV